MSNHPWARGPSGPFSGAGWLQAAQQGGAQCLWWPEGMGPALVGVGWKGWTQPCLEAMLVGVIRTDLG